jgi:hypothetical protein
MWLCDRGLASKCHSPYTWPVTPDYYFVAKHSKATAALDTITEDFDRHKVLLLPIHLEAPSAQGFPIV